jgi:histidyl-tRNA synthetase
MQFDADTVGSASPAADAEMCMMAADTMEALGIPRGSYAVKVNNRKVLDGVMESIGLGGEENAGRRLTVLRAIDKFDRLGRSGVAELLGEGRRDESGDFTKGAGLTSDQIEKILGLLFQVGGWAPLLTRDRASEVELSAGPTPGLSKELYVSNRARLGAMLDGMKENNIDPAGIHELATIAELCDAAGYGPDQIAVDGSVVRGLEYYTGPVYEVELLLDTKDEKGRAVRFGSVGGGGRYDGLVSRFRAETVPATGFSIGVSRLQAALTLLGKLDTTPEFGPVVVTVFDRERVADYQKMVAALRNANIRAELYLGNPKNMGNQLKYADRRNSPCVIIQGGDELNDPEGPQVIVKDLLVGSTVTDVEKDRDRYLQTHRAIQQKVPVSELVVAVQQLLNWHGIVANKFSGTI